MQEARRVGGAAILPRQQGRDATLTRPSQADTLCNLMMFSKKSRQGLTWLPWSFLLLLSCTHSLVSVRDIHDALRWVSKGTLLQHKDPQELGKTITVGAQAAIIPPAWANITVNPCAIRSWQLLYWPQHDKCYKIFSQGPCDEGEEVYHAGGVARCRCEKGKLRYRGRCYQAYTRGPCKLREYLTSSKAEDEAECRGFHECVAGDVFWPQDEKCHRQYTQGPCQHGDLIHLHPDTGWPTCGCDQSLMRMQFWHHTETCHELLTRGPCVTGHVFDYNSVTRKTECGCSSSKSSNYHRETDQCYPLDTQGPCPDGHTFSLPMSAKEPMCTCLHGHLLHVGTGTCQRAYTRAVCRSGEFLIPDTAAAEGVGKCARVPCSNTGQLYHPDTDSCYPVGSRGPCAEGKLWVYERASSLRGRCHCDEKLVGYWAPHNLCYPLGEEGPCPPRHVVTFSPTKGLACSCDRRRGYTRWKGRCERITAADIIRDLISRNLMAPTQEQDEDLTNSVMFPRARSLKDDSSSPLTTIARFIRATTTTTTTPRPTKRTLEAMRAVGASSRGLVNSIEEPADVGSDTHALGGDDDISTRIARLTHRGLITRRTRRPRMQL
ncbi:hypothetical protein HAZT_HAZT002222 [Hyalella azteca]|uniref:DUF4789 domain-containing protein n=1 Tax=Hyalella azteca TaxID=294128 RepID=A0A6A0GSN0_HYAAZ|nr:hypothetical protein HAZT_HAZT002222 [Hyalella azteca]